MKGLTGGAGSRASTRGAQMLLLGEAFAFLDSGLLQSGLAQCDVVLLQHPQREEEGEEERAPASHM